MKKYYKVTTLFLLSLFILSFIFTVSLWLYTNHTYLNIQEKFEYGLQKELSYTKKVGDIIADSDRLKQGLIKNDSYDLLSFLGEQKDKNKIGLMAVADANGILSVRTVSNLGRGTNIFIQTPQGRAVVKGLSTASIEISTFDPSEIYLITARPVKEGGTMLGALFASENLNDIYLKNFKSRYLASNTEVILYTKEYGIYSDTLQTEEQKNLKRLYFNKNSDWIQDGRSGDVVRLSNQHYYRVINLPLQGLERVTAGALIFVPMYPYLAKISFALLFSLIFFYFIARFITRRATKRSVSKFVLYGLIFLTLICFIIFLVTSILFERTPSIKKPPFTIYNSTLRLLPESGVLAHGFRQDVKIIVDTGGETINSINVLLTFDPNLVIVDQIDTENSFCNYFLEKEIDQLKGQVRLSCVKPAPGLFAASGVVASLSLIPKASFTLHFSPESQVLANDGLGTNVLRAFDDASFRLESSLDTVSDPLYLTLYSSTHPNTERWYNDKIVSFNWQNVNADRYVYSLGTATSSILSATSSLAVKTNTIELKTGKDGIYYFHVAAIKNGRMGPISNHKVQIDTAPPQDVRIEASEVEIKKGETIRFEFSGSDATSGVLPNYYVRINDGGFLLPVKKELYVPFSVAGENNLILRLFDKAGNYTEVSQSVTVTK